MEWLVLWGESERPTTATVRDLASSSLISCVEGFSCITSPFQGSGADVNRSERREPQRAVRARWYREVLGRVAEPDHSGLCIGPGAGSLCPATHLGTARLSGSMSSVCEKRERRL